MYRMFNIRTNKKAQYAYHYQKSIIADIEKTKNEIVKIYKNCYFCLDHDNIWHSCTSDSEADSTVSGELLDILKKLEDKNGTIFN